MGIDFFEFKDKNYLVIVDYYSNFWEVDKLFDIKVSIVVLKFKNYFVRYGCLDIVVFDNGL